MTLDRKDSITIPKWLVIVILPILVSLITAYASSKAYNGKQEEKILQNEKAVQRLDDQKVSNKEFGMLQDRLNRIEGKLDNVLNKANDKK